MKLLMLAFGLFALGGLGGLFVSRSERWAGRCGALGAVAGCVAGLAQAVQVLVGGTSLVLNVPWSVPWGSFHLELDALSAFFLVPILALSTLAAVYGLGYLKGHFAGKSLGASWFFFNLLVSSMVLVVLARNAVLFLIAWEVMSLASFFLVTFEHEKESVRSAGWTYLVAMHLGTAFLLAFFMLMGRQAGSMEFDRFAGVAAMPANLLFVLAMVGFGTKAGFWPLHVWLPEAHPAAPSHVSALMSGVMIKTGIYGLVRTFTFLGTPPEWWGWLLIGVGLSSGILAVLFALAQRDLKRILAYSSVENIGIIALGLGVGVLGLHAGIPAVAVLGFAGGLLHVLNHAMFKGMLFLGAGSVLHATHTGQLDRQGGLLKRMPWTGASFLVGAAAISGLPPLNGFISEFLIYLAAYLGLIGGAVNDRLAMLSVIAGLALIGGLAAACFTRAFGIVFLGEPRSPQVAEARESCPAMVWPMVLLAGGCIVVGLTGPWVLGLMAPVLCVCTHLSGATVHEQLTLAAGSLRGVTTGAALVIALASAIAILRLRLLRGRTVGQTVTWDCGYAEPTPRMQYTATSFAQPLTDLFDIFLRIRRTFEAPQGCFPSQASLATHTPDVAKEWFFRPIFGSVAWVAARVRWLQHGRVQLYVLYITITLLVLLMWRLG